MPAGARHATALLGYLCVAVVVSWPLPLHLGDHLPGPPHGDTGVYVWNLWVFRHELIEHHRIPFFTSEILALSQPVSLVLHNYTTFANLIALPLIPMLGIVATYNVLVIGAGVLTGYAMFLLARMYTRDDMAAWVAGVLFAFSPFMTARVTEHFSLTLAAPLPLFALIVTLIARRPTTARAVVAGVIVAWAFLCDTYYAVYCVLMLGFVAVHSVVVFAEKPDDVRRLRLTTALDLALICITGLIVGILVRGGGRVDAFGLRVSMTHLYNPVLALTVLALVRAAMVAHAKVRIVVPPLGPQVRLAIVGAIACAVLLAPVLYSFAASIGDTQPMSPRSPWRSSAPGIDVMALFTPNPMHPLLAPFSESWLQQLPNGGIENVASISWVAFFTIAAAVIAGHRLARRWVLFTVVFALLALGPFVRVAGHLTYVPGPWAVLRYIPVLAAARMPTRITVLVMLGLAMLLALALAHLRRHSTRPALWTITVAGLLIFELLPAPRALYSATPPSVYNVIAADPRPLRVVTVPFGVRDGLRGRGRFSTLTQFYQTVHGKPLVGGYLSRLPKRGIAKLRRNAVMRTIIRLSEGRTVTPEEIDKALERADETLERLQVGYVVVDVNGASPALIDFAQRAFKLTLVATDGPVHLYQTPLAADSPHAQ